MTKIILPLLVFPLIFIACSTQKPAKMKTETNHPKFANSRSFENSPEDLREAAKRALQELIDRSEPATNATVKEDKDKNQISTGWVYGKSKDKYVEYNFNGVPKRKILNVRRKYTYSISPSLAGAEVNVSTEEEIEKVDLKTGETKGWSKMEPDIATYDDLISRLRQKVRAN